jgi:hypothetical protein
MNDSISSSHDREQGVEYDSSKEKLYQQDRDKRLYQYLLTLTDLKRDRSGQYNESYIASQWGMSGNRMFVRRVVRSIEPEKYKEYQDGNLPTIPGITLNKLVDILSSIHKYRQKQISQPGGRIFPQILTRSEKLRALRLYAKLRPEERFDLDLTEHENEALLQQLIEDITDPYQDVNRQRISQICKNIVDNSDLEINLDGAENYDLDRIIKEAINSTTKEYCQYLETGGREKLKEKIFSSVKNTIRDIEYQTGSYQLRKYLDEERHLSIIHSLKNQNSNKISEESHKKEQELDAKFNPQQFILKLVKSIAYNEILAEDFPIHIKYVEFQEVQSLPGIENATSQDSNRVFAYTIRVHFYFNLSTGKTIEFHEDATGVGSPLSHAIAAINRALLWDIPSLKDYIPIAKEVMMHHEIVGSRTNGSVWIHHRVHLCKRIEIGSCSTEDIAYSDYCGFDIVEVSAKAAFYARLRAIKQTGVSPQQYLSELQEKIEKVKDLRKGEKLLNEYPFSREAMRSVLRKKLLSNYYLEDENGCPIPESVKIETPWSLTAYEAHLSITEAYLKEGLYAIGKKYLDCIEPHIRDYQSNPINKIIVARYHLCYFRYHYLTDLADRTHRNSNRQAAVNNANDHLNLAYDCLKDYVNKCKSIDELPHINFYDFFGIMSKLYAHRAKLHLFMSTYQTQQSINKPIELFEEARMCAARSGNSSLYTMWSAYQSWCCLIAGYGEHIDRQNEYIDRADSLLNHALKSYEKTGRSYYESIKQKSGKISGNSNNQKIYESYGQIKIQGMPVIREFKSQDHKKKQQASVGYNLKEGTLTLDMSCLSVDCGNTDDKKTLLFGTQASMLIFSMAMLKLCKYNEDNSSSISEDRIQAAKKMFGYSWSFASDGLGDQQSNCNYDRLFQLDEAIPNSLKMDLESQYLRGLYPHRLTQFADFGKIYFIACELILLSQPSSDQIERWNYIAILLTNLQGDESESERIEGDQKRYNGHLQEHFEAISKYVNSFKELIKPGQSLQLTAVRNIVVRDIAKILQTGQEQVPRLSTVV